VRTFSPDFRRVLRHALRDERLAENLIHHTDKVLQIYNLTPKEIEWMKSYKSVEDIHYDYLAHRISESGFSSLVNLKLIFFVLSAIIFIAVSSYHFLSIFFPQVLASLGIPSWHELSLFMRFTVFAYGVCSFLVILFLFFRPFLCCRLIGKFS
jgi:hypothetical protein